MADETVQTYESFDQFLQHPDCKVYLRRHWEDEWEEVPQLIPLMMEFDVAPNLGSATLDWRYGYAILPKSLAGEVVPPYNAKETIGMYVWIEPQSTDRRDEDNEEARPPNWYGKVVSVGDQWAGDSNSPESEPVARGKQVLACHSIMCVLDTTPILTSVVERLDEDGQQTTREINVCLPFNRLNSHAIDAQMKLDGNRSAMIVSGEAFCFAGSLSPSTDEETNFEPPEKWSLANVLDYLFEFHCPKDYKGDTVIKFSLRRNKVLEGLIDYEVQLDRYDGLTLFQVLNHLIDRRRSLGWYLDASTDDEQVVSFEVVLFTFLTEDVELPTGGTLAAAEKLLELDLTGDRLATVELETDGAVAYDQIIARGDRRGALFQIGGGGEGDDDDVSVPLVADYDTSTDEDSLLDDFMHGPQKQEGFDGMADMEQLAAIDRYRSQPKFERLGQYFCIDPEWELKGTGIGDQGPVCPKLDSSGEPTEESIEIYLPGIRLSKMTPMFTEIDYSGENIADGTAAEALKNVPKESVPDPIPTHCYVKLPLEADGEEHWVPGKLVGKRDGWAGGLGYSVGLTLNETKPGVIVEVRGGQGRSLRGFFMGDIAADDDNAIGTDLHRTVDDLMIVAYAQFQEFVEVRIPPDDEIVDATGERPDLVRRKVISIPDCRLDWVPKGTTVGVELKPTEDGEAMRYELKRTTKAAFIRDDRKRLETVAKIAAEFYLTPRRALTITWRRLRRMVSLGDLIATVGQEARTDTSELKYDRDINTPVTSIRYDLKQATTTVRTGYGELDVRAVI
jgi:hypothetical protein